MIILLKGRRGSGKTHTLTHILHKLQSQGHEVWCNYPVKFPHNLITSFQDLQSIDHSLIVGIDEIEAWIPRLDAFHHQKVAEFIHWIRKTNSSVFLTTQFSQYLPQSLTDAITLSLDCKLDRTTNTVKITYQFAAEPVFALYDMLGIPSRLK